MRFLALHLMVPLSISSSLMIAVWTSRLIPAVMDFNCCAALSMRAKVSFKVCAPRGAANKRQRHGDDPSHVDRRASWLRERHVTFDFLLGIEDRLDAGQSLLLAGPDAKHFAQLIQLLLLRERSPPVPAQPRKRIRHDRAGK